MIRDFIIKNFPKSNLDPTECFIRSEIHLRFELGDGLENGTRERVDQCVNKVTKIFSSLFDDDDEIYILLQSSETDGGVELFKGTDGYLESQFSNFDKIDKDEKTRSISETDLFYNIEKDISEVATITTHYIQKIFKIKLSDVNWKNILKATANLEMGFSPAIAGRVYFINKSKKIAFYMYDDRGCLVFSSELESIRFLYDDYYLEEFDTLFGDKTK